jgi:hypothetical protein
VKKWREDQDHCPLCRGKDEKLSKELAALKAKRDEEKRVATLEDTIRQLRELRNPTNVSFFFSL